MTTSIIITVEKRHYNVVMTMLERHFIISGSSHLLFLTLFSSYKKMLIIIHPDHVITTLMGPSPMLIWFFSLSFLLGVLDLINNGNIVAIVLLVKICYHFFFFL